MKKMLLFLLFLLLLNVLNGQQHFDCPSGKIRKCVRKFPELHYFCKCLTITDKWNKINILIIYLILLY